MRRRTVRKHEIFLVDDDPFILKTIGPALEGRGYQVSTVDSGEQAIEIMAEKDFDLVITDLSMQSIDGIDVLKKAKEIDPEMMIIPARI
jgi:DNA-binding NtrC family response regulator